MVRKLKALMIVNIFLDSLKKTVHNLFTITTNIQGAVLKKKSSRTLKQNP